jgi:hypothetical protein
MPLKDIKSNSGMGPPVASFLDKRKPPASSFSGEKDEFSSVNPGLEAASVDRSNRTALQGTTPPPKESRMQTD